MKVQTQVVPQCGLADRPPRFKSWLYHLLYMFPWASYLTFVCLNFTFVRWGIIINSAFLRSAVKIVQVSTEKHLGQ